ncbi:MAG: hypothetical protein M1826_006550 [Phylliscum demangeonii]|nr:MAG: hypothetical protein M1826_006550 [Phylliscum demangeonii]
MANIQPEAVFNSLTLPDIDPKSHIVGLVGAHDHDNTAAPSADGWLLSDFYLFYRLLAGLGKTQAWCTGLEPAYLVDKYAVFAHGNPWEERRVVLDRALLDGGSEHVVVVPEHDLLAAFTIHFGRVCQQAHAAGEPVLLLVFGHGDQATHGVQIGRVLNGEIPLLSPKMVENTIKELPGLRLSLLVTPCFSGGWATYLNLTAMTAAAADVQSESWLMTHSISLACGSIFASAIVERLRAEDGKAQGDASSEDFTREVQARLMLLDRFGANHQIQFSAQDDDWETEFHARTGVPRAVFKERLESLKLLPPADREAHPHGERTPEEPLREWDQPIEQGLPGRDSMASNHRVHSLARACLDGKCGREDLERLAAGLDYRERAMQIARLLLPVMGVTSFTHDWEWDHHDWLAEADVRTRMNKGTSAFSKIIAAGLIPSPGKDEDYFYPKPVYYVIAGLYAQNFTDDEIDRRIERASRWRDKQVKLAADRLLQSIRKRRSLQTPS